MISLVHKQIYLCYRCHFENCESNSTFKTLYIGFCNNDHFADHTNVLLISFLKFYCQAELFRKSVVCDQKITEAGFGCLTKEIVVDQLKFA